MSNERSSAHAPRASTSFEVKPDGFTKTVAVAQLLITTSPLAMDPGAVRRSASAAVRITRTDPRGGTLSHRVMARTPCGPSRAR